MNLRVPVKLRAAKLRNCIGLVEKLQPARLPRRTIRGMVRVCVRGTILFRERTYVTQLLLISLVIQQLKRQFLQICSYCRECVGGLCAIHLLININFQIELSLFPGELFEELNLSSLAKTRSGINRAPPNSRNEGLLLITSGNSKSEVKIKKIMLTCLLKSGQLPEL